MSGTWTNHQERHSREIDRLKEKGYQFTTGKSGEFSIEIKDNAHNRAINRPTPDRKKR